MTEKYIVAVGDMWVSKFKGELQESGQIHAITSIQLTSDKAKATKFDNPVSAKSVANKIRTYGYMEKI